MYLRLADEDEIIGTDWAEMGERAYGYLPFDEELSRSSNEDNANVVRDTRIEKNSKSPRLSKMKKLLMVDRQTVIKGVPDLIEQPVLDYGQHKDLGSLPLGSLARPTGGDLLQKAPAKVEEEHQLHEPVDFDHHPMSKESYNHHRHPYERNDTAITGSSTSATPTSSTSSEKMKEKV